MLKLACTAKKKKNFIQQNYTCVDPSVFVRMLELSFLRTFAPGNESSVERKSPWNERGLSFPGTFAP